MDLLCPVRTRIGPYNGRGAHPQQVRGEFVLRAGMVREKHLRRLPAGVVSSGSQQAGFGLVTTGTGRKIHPTVREGETVAQAWARGPEGWRFQRAGALTKAFELPSVVILELRSP